MIFFDGQRSLSDIFQGDPMMFAALVLMPMALAILAWRKRKQIGARGFLAAGAAFALVSAAGLWAILQSRSSTAAIGILFLPIYGGPAAIGGALLAMPSRRPRLNKALGLILILIPLIYFIQQGLTTIQTNKDRDETARLSK
jgi:hypothetical protein